MKFELAAFNRNVTDEELLQDLVATDAKEPSINKGINSYLRLLAL